MINFKFPLQPHQKYYIAQHGEIGLSKLYSDDIWYYPTLTTSLKRWENVLSLLGGERVKIDQMPTCTNTAGELCKDYENWQLWADKMYELVFGNNLMPSAEVVLRKLNARRKVRVKPEKA